MKSFDSPVRRVVWLLLAVLCVFLTACGSSEPAETTAAPTEPTTPPATSATTTEPATTTATTTEAVTTATTTTPAATTEATTTEPAVDPRYLVDFTSKGETIRLEAVEIRDYSPIDCVPDPAEAVDVPSIRGWRPYKYDSTRFQFAFADGSQPVYEKYRYFRDGELVVAGAPGITPDEDGEYLLCIDFMYADAGKITARRAAVNMTLAKYDDDTYDRYAAAKVPRDGLTPKAPLSEEYIAWLAEMDDYVFDAGTDDPEEALRLWITESYADELASDDPFYKLDDVKVLEVELCSKSYLDLYNVYTVFYSDAIRPASPEYHMLQYPMDTNVFGTGELEGWMLSNGIAYMRYYGDGIWCRYDHMWGSTTYQPSCGMTFCGDDPVLREAEIVWPEDPVIPDYSDPSVLLNQPWRLLEDPDKLDWEEVCAVSGLEYCRYLFALNRANAFSSLPNRDPWYGDILGNYSTFPQAMRTVAVMLAANNVIPELAEDYANLLRELKGIDPEGFDYALTQVSAERAAEVLAMVAPGNDEPEAKALWCLEFERTASEPCPDTTEIYLAADRAELRQVLENVSAACGSADPFPAGRSVFPDSAFLCDGKAAAGGEKTLYSAAELAGAFDDAFFNGAKAVIVAETVPYDDGFASGRGIVTQTEDGLLLSTEMEPSPVDLLVTGKKLYVSCWRVEDSAWENGALTYEAMYGQVLTQDEAVLKRFRKPIPAPAQ